MTINNRGMGLTGAMLLMAVTMISMATLSQQIVLNAQATSRMREMTAANNLRMGIKELLRSPLHISCDNNGGIQNCQYNNGSHQHSFLSKVEKLTQSYTLATCGNRQSSCAIEIVKGPEIIKHPVENLILGRFHYRFRTDVASNRKKDVFLEVPVPVDLIQHSDFQCDTIMEGFTEDGGVKCKEFNLDRAEPGQFISSIDPNTLEPTFEKLPSRVSDCATGDNYLASYRWLGGANYKNSCGKRINPFLLEN